MRSAIIVGWLKVIGALLLIACFALPMKSCTMSEVANGKPVVAVPGGSAPGMRYVTERHYLWEELHAQDPKSWLRVAVFLGPAAALIFVRRRPTSRAGNVLWVIEPLLLAGVVYSLWDMTFLTFYDPDIGWYVASVGVASYFAGWLVETCRRWWQWRHPPPET